MTRRTLPTLLLPLLLLLLCGCPRQAAEPTFGEVLYAPHSAEGFEIVATEGASTVLRILSPWPASEGVVKEVFVARQGECPPEGFRGTTVASSPERVVCMSSSHVAFISVLGLSESIVGISGTDYITSPEVRASIARGTTREVGYDANLNYELITSLRPDVVFIYGTTGESSSMTTKLSELGIPYIYMGEHIERTPLGKSEWVVAVGELFDCRIEAEDIFNGIGERYESLRLSALSAAERPRVMLNAPYKDVWFVPATESYVVRLIEDAAGEYLCRGEQGGELSRPISGESAYLLLSRADFWLHPNDHRSLESLAGSNPKFAECAVVRNKGVYNCTAISTPAGGSDFWESGALWADRVLADLISILHPELRANHTLHYYEQLH